jgi:hypothetical protein
LLGPMLLMGVGGGVHGSGGHRGRHARSRPHLSQYPQSHRLIRKRRWPGPGRSTGAGPPSGGAGGPEPAGVRQQPGLQVE